MHRLNAHPTVTPMPEGSYPTPEQRQLYRDLRKRTERQRLRRKQLIERVVAQRREEGVRSVGPPSPLGRASARTRRPG
jgi:hypothetical protein